MKKQTAPSAAGPGADKLAGEDNAFPARGKRLPMPHERDESSDALPGTGPRRDEIHRASQDLAQGQVDTDMRATPGLDSQHRESLVPGEAGRSPQRRGDTTNGRG